ncbi:MAG: caspase family protein [Pseudonocardiaceae bacterium]
MFPRPARSRALLIGASHFTVAGPDLPDIPAVQANLTALRQTLTSPDTGVLKPESCRVLTDPATVDEVGTALSELAATATDLLLVYYAGHGLVDDRGRLHLALAHTHPHRARWTAFPLELLREEIANSAAATRVLILDCCFSGRAIEAMADDQGGDWRSTRSSRHLHTHLHHGERPLTRPNRRPVHGFHRRVAARAGRRRFAHPRPALCDGRP